MESSIRNDKTELLPISERKPYKRWAQFAGKSLVFLVVLFVLSRTIIRSVFPVWAVALVWTLLSVVALVGVVYPVVIRKTHRQAKYEKGGRFSRWNNGRTFSLIVGFVLSAILIAGLLLETPKWKYEWVLIVASIPLYLGVALLMKKFFWKEYKPLFRDSGVTAWSGVVTGLLLCLIYFIITLAQSNFCPTHLSTAEAFLQAKSPFDQSSSTLLREGGIWAALTDGYAQVEISKIAVSSQLVGSLLRTLLVAPAFFGVTSILSVFFLEWREVKRVFMPLANPLHPSEQHKISIKYVVVVVIFSVCLIVGFLFSEDRLRSVSQDGANNPVRPLACEFVGQTMCSIDGKYYDRETVDKHRGQADNINNAAKTNLDPLINESFDKRKDNVDGYLDWYYGLDAEKARLSGSAEQEISAKLVEYVEKYSEDDQLRGQWNSYYKKSQELEDELSVFLQEEALQDVPDWMKGCISPCDCNSMSELLAPVNRFLTIGRIENGLGLTKDDAEKIDNSGQLPLIDGLFQRSSYKQQIDDLIEEKRNKLLGLDW